MNMSWILDVGLGRQDHVIAFSPDLLISVAGLSGISLDRLIKSLVAFLKLTLQCALRLMRGDWHLILNWPVNKSNCYGPSGGVELNHRESHVVCPHAQDLSRGGGTTDNCGD